jgi:FkbM family methyltransferase
VTMAPARGVAAGPAAALRRSVRMYHGDKERNRAMDALYARFVGAGDLAFDIGAHVGDRVSSFRRLGARVVALEPQPGPARVLRLIHGRDPEVALLEAAAGDAEGTVTLHLNTANPTVSTASAAFVAAAEGAGGWEGQMWDRTITVPCLTLDRLIRDHGRPAFVKVDVEGFEDRVLAGLSEAVPALSFEFTTIARGVAQGCLARMCELGDYGFDVALGESQEFVFGRFIDRQAMADYLRELPHEANSGDVYAVLP